MSQTDDVVERKYLQRIRDYRAWRKAHPNRRSMELAFGDAWLLGYGQAADEIERLREENAWRPIESAPKMVRILLFSPGYEPVIGRRWGRSWGHSDEDAEIPYGPMDDPRWTPTHWKLLPAPPSIEGAPK